MEQIKDMNIKMINLFQSALKIKSDDPDLLVCFYILVFSLIHYFTK